jgi:hypothetical protein
MIPYMQASMFATYNTPSQAQHISGVFDGIGKGAAYGNLYICFCLVLLIHLTLLQTKCNPLPALTLETAAAAAATASDLMTTSTGGPSP